MDFCHSSYTRVEIAQRTGRHLFIGFICLSNSNHSRLDSLKTFARLIGCEMGLTLLVQRKLSKIKLVLYSIDLRKVNNHSQIFPYYYYSITFITLTH